jgi:hypothetical protein
MDVYLGLRTEVTDFTLATGLQPVVLSRGKYLGQTEGTAEETMAISFRRQSAPMAFEERTYFGEITADPGQTQMAGIRTYVVFVVDRKGNVSNSLTARVTVQ